MVSFLKRLFGLSTDQPAPTPVTHVVEQAASEPAVSTASREPQTTAEKADQPEVVGPSVASSAARPVSEVVFAEILRQKQAELSTKNGVSGRSGGVYINGGTITVGGDIVGGDRIVIVSDGTIDRLFEPLLNDVKEIEPESLRAEARQRIIEIRDQAKCYSPDLVVVGTALKWLTKNTPGLTPRLREVLAESCMPRSMRELAVVLLGGKDQTSQ